MQLTFALDFPFATLGVQGIAVSPIHTPSMESVVGFSSFGRKGGKKRQKGKKRGVKYRKKKNFPQVINSV